ncbi:mediator complex subunit, partial [Ascosphaera aggregata]
MAQISSSRPESRTSNYTEKTTRHPDHLAASIELLQKKPSLVVSSPPPELTHISQGLYPFAQLLNRATQQTWNDLNELLNGLAEPASKVANGSSTPPSALENAQKRSKIMQFAQDKRNSFIKLLVLSQWSYRAIDVGKLIDLQAFFRSQYQAYTEALVFTGEMKRDLVRAQTGSPDLATAIRLLSVDTTLLAKDTGLVPPKPLAPHQMLRTLKDVNRILKKRLILHENIPEPFSKYFIHDGRVTFVIDKMFELDLSVADDNNDSQFFYIDLRFRFSPSAILPSEKVFRGLEESINFDLKAVGLQGCFEHINNLVLSMKIAILHQQALQLPQSIWSSKVHVLLTHRTLVVQYWIDKPGPKSWLQIGISRRTETSKVPTLTLRWVCDGNERPADKITFDHSQLSTRAILKSVVASHTSLTLSAIYRGLCDMPPFAGGALYIGLHLSLTEPGDCCLIVQLTKKRTVRVFVEPSTGTTMLHVSPPLLGAYDGFRPSHQPPSAIINRICFLRCIAVSEELHSLLRGLQLENAPLSSSCRDDLRRRFSPSTVKIDTFRHESLGDDWGIVLANGHDGDSWWVVQYTESDFVTSNRLLGGQPVHSKRRNVKALHMVITNFLTPQNDISYAQLASLKLACLGTIVLHTNLEYIEQLGTLLHTPSSSELQLTSNLH